MRKATLLIFGLAILLLYSCGQPAQQRKNTREELPLESFVSQFRQSHPDMLNNDATLEEGNEEFKTAFEKAYAKQDMLEGIPVELTCVNKADGKYVAQFQSWILPSGFEFQDSIKEVCFDVIGVVPDSTAKQLKDKEYYLLKTKFVSFVNFEAMFALLGRETIGVTDKVGLEKDDVYEEKVCVHLARLYVDINEVKPFK